MDDEKYHQAAINSSAIITGIGDVLDVCLNKSTSPNKNLPGIERVLHYPFSLERNRRWIEQGVLEQIQENKTTKDQ